MRRNLACLTGSEPGTRDYKMRLRGWEVSVLSIGTLERRETWHWGLRTMDRIRSAL